MPIQCQISSSIQKDLEEILIVNTLDGFIHGINKTTGLLLWSKSMEASMVSVKHSLPKNGGNDENAKETHSNNYLKGVETTSKDVDIKLDSSKEISTQKTKEEQVVFIPEPAADGNLYYIQPGKGLQVFSYINSRNSILRSRKLSRIIWERETNHSSTLEEKLLQYSP